MSFSDIVKAILPKTKALLAIKTTKKTIFRNFTQKFNSIVKKAAPKHTNFYIPKTAYLMLVFLACFFSCATKHNIEKKEVTIDTNPKLIFLNYTISKNEDGEKSITLIDKKIVDGKLRNKGSKYIKSGKIGDLVSEQLDENKNTLYKQAIANPFIKSIEVTTDSLTLKKQIVSIKQTPLNLRLQLDVETKFIRLTEVIDSLENTKPIITTPID